QRHGLQRGDDLPCPEVLVCHRLLRPGVSTADANRRSGACQPELDVGPVQGALGGGCCYLAMEWLPQALDKVLRAQYPEPLAVGTALRLARGVAVGPAAVHAAAVVHRDVKPSNRYANQPTLQPCAMHGATLEQI